MVTYVDKENSRQRGCFTGTNRHEFDCYSGRACDQKLIEQDIITMKQNNINAVRCSIMIIPLLNAVP